MQLESTTTTTITTEQTPPPPSSSSSSTPSLLAPSVRLAVACNYCSKSTVNITKNENVTNVRRGPPQVTLATSPPSPVSPSTAKNAIIKSDTCICKKPRSRCSFCFSRLDTSSTLSMFQPSLKTNINNEQLTAKRVRHPFEAFTVFCVTCRHSGHAIHYIDWFKTNSNCPVSGCTCSCSSIDSYTKFESIN